MCWFTSFSYVFAISVMQGYRILITEKSVNLIKEIKNYTWQFDEKTKRFINKPADGQADHLLDASRYWVMGEIMGRIKEDKDLTGIFTH